MEDYKKKYEEALERAKKYHIGNGNFGKSTVCVLEEIFPELAESEDEKIRKELIEFCKTNLPYASPWISWLEKQCEQKQDPCEHCENVMLNCYNFPCIKKKAFEQGKSVFDVINEEKVDNANKIEQKPEELSEDEKMIRIIIKTLRYINKKNKSMMGDILLENCIAWLEKQKPIEYNEKYVAEIFEKVGLAKVVRELANDKLTNTLQDAMIELGKQQKTAEWSEEDEV